MKLIVQYDVNLIQGVGENVMKKISLLLLSYLVIWSNPVISSSNESFGDSNDDFEAQNSEQTQTQPQTKPQSQTTKNSCQPSSEANAAITRAAEAWDTAEYTPGSYTLILDAKAAAGPPECNSARAVILADEALLLINKKQAESTEYSEYESSASKISVSRKQTGFFLEWDLLSKINFDDGVLAGDYISMTGLNIGYTFESQYVVGYQGNFSFLFEPNLDNDRNVDFEDELELSAFMLYLRRNWVIGEGVTGFAMLGYSQVEAEIEVVSYHCFFGCDSTTTSVYKNKETGPAWGAGVQWEIDNGSFISLKYIKYSASPFEFEGFHVGLIANWWD